jgi:hypothetical protein
MAIVAGLPKTIRDHILIPCALDAGQSYRICWGLVLLFYFSLLEWESLLCAIVTWKYVTFF